MELRMFPGIQRDSKEWNDTYKIRSIVERAINHFKINMCIASQLAVIVVHAMNCTQYIRSLKPLVA